MKNRNYSIVRFVLFAFLFYFGSLSEVYSQCNSISCNETTNDSDNYSSAIGDSTTALGRASFAAGVHSQATGYNSYAAGLSSVAGATSSLTLGNFLHATANNAFVLGSGADNNNPLINNTPSSLMVGFKSIYPTLTVKGPEFGTEKTGRIAIGNMTEPQAKLHIYSDDDESATLFLQPANWNSDYKASLWMGNQNNGITADIDKGLLFDSEHYFVFNTGNVGLGTDEPTATLDVDGSARIRSLAGEGDRVVVVDSAGNLNTTFLSGQCVSCESNTVDFDAYASAIGHNNSATGQFSFAGGENSEANGNFAFAFGNGTIADELNSVAMGYNNYALGLSSFTFGSSSTTGANATNAITLGSNLFATGPFSFIIGSGDGSDHTLNNSISRSLMIGFRSIYPTLFIGPSPAALDHNSTGRVAIGNMTDPQAKLHIYSDDDESATLFLQPSNWNSDYKASLWMGNQNNGITADIDKGLLFDSEHDFIFNSGKVGIGVTEPTATLDVDGSARIRNLTGEGERVVVADSAGNLNTTFLSDQCISCENTENSGLYSSAIGYNTKALGIASFASGTYSEANGDNSTAIGMRNQTIGLNSTSLGSYIINNGSNAVAIGSGSGIDYELVNSIAYSVMFGTKSTVPTLFISTSPTRYSTGKIAIGNVPDMDPKAKLHIYSDDNEAAVLFLQPSNWTTQYNAEIWMGDTNHRIVADIDKGLVFKTNNQFVFEDGNLGIGTEQPATKLEITAGDVYINDLEKGIIMKSPDGKCWRGTLNNSGSLNFTLLESCPDSPSALPENNNSGKENDLKVYPNPTHDYLNVEVENLNHKSLTFSLIAESGKLVKTSIMSGNKTQFYIGDVKAGVYFVKVTGSKVEIRSEKVIIQ